MKRDRIYRSTMPHPDGFVFDDHVARVFADMIARSVPGYGQTLQMVELLAHKYAQEGTQLYDLGCSLGAATLALARGAGKRNCRIIAVDNSPAMLARCRELLANEAENIEIIEQDIIETDIHDASIVVLNFVLQFIPPSQRQPLLKRIRDGLLPGGVLILSEKIGFEDARENRLQIELHEAFKQAQGYSRLEISRKRNALENVLIPETLKTHHRRLRQVGFPRSYTWFQCFNFASIIAFA